MDRKRTTNDAHDYCDSVGEACSLMDQSRRTCDDLSEILGGAEQALDDLVEAQRNTILKNIQQRIQTLQEAQAAELEGDYKKAYLICREGLFPKDSEEMYNWGVAYYNGTGVEQSFESAFFWFEAASELGHVTATAILGYMYYEEQFVPKDDNKAFELFKKAAMDGDEQAALFLGIMYYNGEGTEQNNELALKWIKEAELRGHKEAHNEYEEISKEIEEAKQNK